MGKTYGVSQVNLWLENKDVMDNSLVFSLEILELDSNEFLSKSWRAFGSINNFYFKPWENNNFLKQYLKEMHYQ